MSDVLLDLEKSRRVIKKKYRKLRRQQGLAKQEITQTLQPLIAPLQNLAKIEVKHENGESNGPRKFEFKQSPRKNDESEESNSEYFDYTINDATVIDDKNFDGDLNMTFAPLPDTDDLADRYVREMSHSDSDRVYGPVYDPVEKSLRLGQLPLVLEKDVIRVGEQEFPKSLGLYELIFKKEPQHVNEEDKDAYKKIMHLSRLHHDENDKLKYNNSHKYRTFIKLLRSPTASEKKMKNMMGGSLSRRRKSKIEQILSKTGKLQSLYSEKPTQYVYWDDPNELVQRLELLLSEREAGHTGLDNEILSILEELKERGYIAKSNNSKLVPLF